MSPENSPSILVKAEADFYAALETCPADILARTRGIRKYREDSALYLEITPAILDPESLFVRYLKLPAIRDVFGAHNPLFTTSTLEYQGENPLRLNHFNTRLLLAFFEVQLALGFSGESFRRHQLDLENLLQGKPARLVTNYYHPFTHEDNVGIHYVLHPDGRPGYSNSDWQNFIQYAQNGMRAAFKVSPDDFGGNEDGLERKLREFCELVSDPYLKTGILNNPPIRHLGILIQEVLFLKGGLQAHYVSNPRTGRPMEYLPLMDCLLDMPYRSGSMVIFQSTCAGK